MACFLGLMGGAAMAQTRIGVSGTLVYNSKVYDGTTNCGVYYVGQLTNISINHSVVVTATAHYLDRHVGANKPVVVTYAISGDDAALYLPPVDDTLTADITPLSLSITGVQVASKPYDRMTSGTIQNFGLLHTLPAVDSGNVFPSCLVRFLDVNAGANRPVEVTYYLVCTGTSQVADFVAPPAEVLSANILPRQAYADGVVIAATKTYDGTTSCAVTNPGTLSGVLDGDTISYSVSAQFRTRHVAPFKAVDVTCNPLGPQAGNYTISDTINHIASVQPLQISWYLPEVQLVKEYDGTADAIVLVPGGASNILPFDTVAIDASAAYDSPEVGHNKVISCRFLISGPQAANYTHDNSTPVCSDQGAIILPTQLADLENNGQLLRATAQGFCQGTNVGIRYSVAQGEPTSYSVTFSDEAVAQGFSNIGWTPRDQQDTIVLFSVPANCPEGDYTAYITFRNEANGTTAPIACTFHVNIPNTYLVQVFDDVVSIDNSGSLDGRVDRFSSYQWYHNGQQINDTKPYHQEIGGLTGQYSVRVNLGTADEGYVCPKAFTPSSKVSVVHVYPSPVVLSATVKLQGFHDGQHNLQVFDNHGTQVLAATFSGYECQLDMSALAPGSYLISVDGRTAKTIKM